MIFKDREKAFSNDYFLLISEFIKRRIKEGKVKRLAIIINDEDAFKFEFLVLIFYLSIQRFAVVFNDEKKEKRILDNIHDTYYAFLKTQRNITGERLENFCNCINDRYRNYNFCDDKDNGKWALKLSRQFLRHLDFYHKTNFKDDLDKVVTVASYIKMFGMITKDSVIELKKHHKL